MSAARRYVCDVVTSLLSWWIPSLQVWLSVLMLCCPGWASWSQALHGGEADPFLWQKHRYQRYVLMKTFQIIKLVANLLVLLCVHVVVLQYILLQIMKIQHNGEILTHKWQVWGIRVAHIWAIRSYPPPCPGLFSMFPRKKKPGSHKSSISSKFLNSMSPENEAVMFHYSIIRRQEEINCSPPSYLHMFSPCDSLSGHDVLQPDHGGPARLEDLRRHEEPGWAEVRPRDAGATPT